MSGRSFEPVVVLPWPPRETQQPPVCGRIHPEAGRFAAQGVLMLPCHLELGHEGVHCFDCDAAADPGTLRLELGRACLDYAEHMTACDACRGRTGPACPLGAMRLRALADLIDGLLGRDR